MIVTTNTSFGTRLKEHQKAVFFCKKENSALSEHTCLTNHTIGWDKSKIITTNRRCYQRLCLEAGILTPPTLLYIMMMAARFLTPIYTSSEKKAQLISDRIKRSLVIAFRSPLMKELDRNVETLSLWIVTSSITYIKFVNQSSIKPCPIVHLVAMWTLIYNNKWVASDRIAFAQRFLGSSRSKHRNSPKITVWLVVSTSKTTI